MPRGVKKVVVEDTPEEVVLDVVDEAVEAPASEWLQRGGELKLSRPTAPATGKWEKVSHDGKFYMAAPDGRIVTSGIDTENKIADMVMSLNNKRR